jgi:hypothetical protein
MRTKLVPLLCLLQRARAAIHVVEAVDEDASEAKERIRPVAAKLRGFSKQGDGFAELALRVGVFVPLLGGFAIDAVEMPFAVAKGGQQPRIVRRDRDRPAQRVARRRPLRFADVGQSHAVVADDAVGKRQRAFDERVLEPDGPEMQAAAPGELVVRLPQVAQVIEPACRGLAGDSPCIVQHGELVREHVEDDDPEEHERGAEQQLPLAAYGRERRG